MKHLPDSESKLIAEGKQVQDLLEVYKTCISSVYLKAHVKQHNIAKASWREGFYRMRID